MNSSDPHVCNNAPRPSDTLMLEVQDGWQIISTGVLGGTKIRAPRMKMIPFVMTRECQYDKDHTDKRCKGCKHGMHVLKDECTHQWKLYPVAKIEGTEWCVRCGESRPLA